MSFRKRWVISCDMIGCHSSNFVGSTAHTSRREETEIDARSIGWGFIQIGKFKQNINLCPECRVKLQHKKNPTKFWETITSSDHTSDHTILLDCGHEFTQVDVVGTEQADCAACRREWFISGDVDELPELEDLIPSVIP